MRRKEDSRVFHWWFVAVLFLLGGLHTACTDYQDEVDALDRRVKDLEELVEQVNEDLESMQVLLAAIEAGDYITGVRETDDGYVINFKKAGPVYIHDGQDGRDGQDAKMPDIDVAQDEAGNFYWTVDGEPVTGPDGKPVRVNGRDGKDGKDGKDAVQPELRINPETGYWEVSVDDGQTWMPTGTSAQGKDGKDGNEFFVSVNYEVTADGEFMTITTKSGQTFRIPIYKNA